MELSISSRQVSRGCGIAITLFGIYGIIGSIISSSMVALYQGSYVPVSPISPILFIFLGVALIVSDLHYPAVKPYSLIISIITILMGINYLAESGGGINTGFHSTLLTLFPSVIVEKAGMMSPVSALSFIFIGISAFSLIKGYNTYGGLPATIVLAISSTFIFGYIFGSPLMHQSSFIPVSLPSAIGFILLSVGYITQAGTNFPPLSLFSGESSRAILMRYLLPVIICLVISLKFIDHLITESFQLNPAIMVSIEVLIALVIITAVVIILSATLGRRLDTINVSLVESEEKFRTLFDMAPIACSVMNTQEDLILINKYLENMTGYSSSEILGRRGDEVGLFSSDERIHLSEKLKKQGYLRDEEITVLTRLGEVRSQLASSSLVMLQGERHILSTMVDITDRRRMEDDLRKTKDQVTGIAETIPGVVFQFYAKNSGEMGLSYVSKRAFEIFGEQGDLSSFLQKLISGLVPDDREPFLASINQAIKEETRWYFEGRFVKPSGDLLYFRGVSAPVREGDELVFSGVILDITGQKETESALLESERAYRELFNNSILGIFRITAEGEFINLNPAFARMYGYDSTEDMKRELKCFGESQYLVPDEWRTIRDILARDGEIQKYECEHRRKDGSNLWVSINAKVIRNDSGDLQYVEGTVEDITKRKFAESELIRKQNELRAAYLQLAGVEEELRHQYSEIVDAQNEIEKREKKFRQLFEANIAGIVLHEIITDESGIPCDYRYLDANSAFERITGHSFADIALKTIREVKPDCDPEWIKKYGKVALTGEPIHFESYDVNKELYFDVNVYSPEKGQFATVFLDMTARKLAENAISETNAYLENLISNAFGPIMVWDNDFIITRINRSCENLLGKGADSLISKNLLDLLSADQAEALIQKINLFPDHRVRDTIELKMEHQDGTTRTVVWSMSTIMDPNKEYPVATIAQGWDVTSERELEKERVMAIEKINENIAKIAILNDGIRNPLSIMACIIDSTDDPEIMKLLNNEIQRIDQMVTNLDIEWINSEKVLNFLRRHDYGH
ncbi:MAG: PAS domain S-box protein [Methanomicrobiales archaeon]|nr:PAS domain S-box protein [Methanomicrobiales archaeon]